MSCLLKLLQNEPQSLDDIPYVFILAQLLHVRILERSTQYLTQTY